MNKKVTFHGNVALRLDLEINEEDIPRNENGDIDYEAIKKIVTIDTLPVIGWPQTVRTFSADRCVVCSFDKSNLCDIDKRKIND